MLTSRLRSGKLRIAVLISVAVGIVCTIYVLRDTHVKLNDAKRASEKCQHQQESLAAQLQVIYEHKNRLFKSLEQEKLDHKKSKSDVQAQCERMREIDKHEANNRFNSIQQQHKMLQIQMEDLQEELNKVQRLNVNLIREKQELINSQATQIELGKQNEIQTNNLKTQINECEQRVVDLNKEAAESKHKLIESQLKLSSCEKRNENATMSQSLTATPVTDKATEHLENREKQIATNDSVSNREVKEETANERYKKEQIEPAQNQVDPGVIHEEGLMNRDEEKRAVPEEFQENGLEQQENGDQDLDNMDEKEDEDEGEGAAQQQQPPQKAFDDADFDQLYEGGKQLGPKDSAPLDNAQ